jgi:hypothetical protein
VTVTLWESGVVSLIPSEVAWRVGVVVGGMTAVGLGRGLYAVRV